MDMIMLAIIGSEIEANVVYWVCFGIYCTVRVCGTIAKVILKMMD